MALLSRLLLRGKSKVTLRPPVTPNRTAISRCRLGKDLVLREIERESLTSDVDLGRLLDKTTLVVVRRLVGTSISVQQGHVTRDKERFQR